MKKFFASLGTFFKNAGRRIGNFAKKHKIVSALIVLVIIGCGYWSYTALAASKAGSEYVLSTTTQGPLQVTVTGSGQVTANDTLNITPQGSASGRLTEVNVTPGEQVAAGTVIAEIDTTNAAEAVTSARQDLESANISYQQTLTSSQTGVTSDQTSVTGAETTLASSITTTYTNLPAVMNGINSVMHDLSRLHGHTAQANNQAYESFVDSAESQQDEAQAEQDFLAAQSAYQQAQNQYQSSNVNSLDDASLEALAHTTVQTTATIDTLLRDELTFLNYINDQVIQGQLDVPPDLASQISSVNSYQTTVSGDNTSVTNAQTSLINAQNNLGKDTQSLSTTNTPLTVQSAQLSVAKAQAALTQAETTEADYIIRAPFAGTIATVPVNKYDQASSGTTVATLIAAGNYVDLSLNEADISKIQVGQPASLTFDAIDGLTATGTVAEVDPVGTVSQGVVTYTVKIGLTSSDSRIKPGMTADATIVTASVNSALQVSSSAIHTTNGSSYVEVATFKNASSTLAAMRSGTGSSTSATASRRVRTSTSTSMYSGGAGYGRTSSSTTSSSGSSFSARSITVPETEVTVTQVPVVTGISNDTMVQIVSGLRPGQYIVTSTVSSTTAKKTTSSTGLFGLLGGSSSTRRTTTGTTGTGTGTTRTGSYGGGTTGTGGGFTGGPPSGGGAGGGG